jgi:hypothetical protein
MGTSARTHGIGTRGSYLGKAHEDYAQEGADGKTTQIRKLFCNRQRSQVCITDKNFRTCPYIKGAGRSRRRTP